LGAIGPSSIWRREGGGGAVGGLAGAHNRCGPP